MPDFPHFLIMTPLGLQSHLVQNHFRQAGIQPYAKMSLYDWANRANQLRDQPESRKAFVFSQIWQLLFPANKAEVWLLHEHVYLQALALKPYFRQILEQVAFCLLPASSQLEHRLYPFHLPEPHELDSQWKHLQRLLSHA